MVNKFLENVRKRDGSLVPYSRKRIEDAIFAAAKAVGGQDRKIAEELTEKVEHRLKMKFGARPPSVEDIQDAVEKQLIESGHAKTAKAYILYRQKRTELRDSRAFLNRINNIVDDYVQIADWRVSENSNASYSLSGLQAHVSGAIIAEYALRNIYPEEISNAHRSADFHIHDLGNGVFSGYSFYRNETVVVREKGSGEVLCLALEQLFDLVDAEIVCDNGFEIKHADGFEVLDENGWAGLRRVLRHKTDKQLLSINSYSGNNLVVTADHPFITLEQEKLYFKCERCGSKEIFKNRSNQNGFDRFKCRQCGANFKKRIEFIADRRKEMPAAELSLKNYTLSPSFSLPEGLEQSLTAEDGWFVGLFIAEGYFKSGHYLGFDLSPQSLESHKLLSYLQANGALVSTALRNRETSFWTTVDMGNILMNQVMQGTLVVLVDLNRLSSELRSAFEHIRPFSENKNLPIDFLNHSDAFVGGMVSGIIDGDGIVRNDDKWVSRAVVRVTSKTMLGQMQFWLHAKKINSALSSIDSFGEREYKGKIIRGKKQLYALSIYIPETKAHLFSQSIKITQGEFKFSGKEPIFKKFSLPRKIEAMPNDSPFVYDLTTTSHTFLCNGMLAHNCAGWSLRQLLEMGFGGVSGRVSAKPAKHFNAALGQIVNFMGTLQNEWAGAQAFSSFDTYLAPLVKYDNLDYKRVKQSMQEFIFAINATSRWGNQVPFTNLTMDWVVPEDMKDVPVMLGGKEDENSTYSDYREEMGLINKAFIDVMTDGDCNGRVFTFPIPTYNVTRDFDWESENSQMLFEMAAKYGIPYFQNFINSSLKPSDVRSMCLVGNEKMVIKANGKIERTTMEGLVNKFASCFSGHWAEPLNSVSVLSLNPESYEIEWAAVKSFFRTQDNIIVSIKAKDGKTINVSKDHPVAVYTEQGLETKRAEEVKIGDILITANDASKCLNNEKQFLAGLELDESFSRFIGLFLAEGNFLFEARKNMRAYGKERGIQFTFSEREGHLVGEVAEFARSRLGKEAKIKKDPRYKILYVYIYKSDFARLLAAAGIKKRGALSSVLFNSSKEVIEAFLQGFFEGDGYVDGKEIHINDAKLASDLVILFTLVGKPVTFRLRKNSQVIRLQHTSGRGAVQGVLKNDFLYNRVPQFVASTGKTKPFYAKQFMVSASAIEKHTAHTNESLKLLNGCFSTVKVESIAIQEKDEPVEFYDIELEKNHFFVHSLGNITHNCCRLQLNLKELKSKTGGLFGSGEKTGSIGVVTINMPKLGYLSRDENDFFERLDNLLYLAKESLEIKRKEVNKNMESGLLPWSKRYLGLLNNHFSTIGLVGMNECLLNFMETGIASKEGKQFALKTLDFFRSRLTDFQNETGHIFNLEATPAEGTSYRLARIDKKNYSGIKTAGKDAPYYTNSTQLPVGFTDDIFDALRHQDGLQCKYTGGTVLHGFLGEAMDSGEACGRLVKKIARGFKLPYYTITPTFSVCPVHGYVKGKHFSCPVETNDKEVQADAKVQSAV